MGSLRKRLTCRAKGFQSQVDNICPGHGAVENRSDQNMSRNGSTKPSSRGAERGRLFLIKVFFGTAVDISVNRMIKKCRKSFDIDGRGVCGTLVVILPRNQRTSALC